MKPINQDGMLENELLHLCSGLFSFLSYLCYNKKVGKLL